MNKPNQYKWKPFYTVVLIANLCYVLLMYWLMNSLNWYALYRYHSHDPKYRFYSDLRDLQNQKE